jgi:hypothetical protein
VDRLCVPVVRVSGYRSWGPGFDSRRYQIFWEVVGLERGPLSLVRITEELLEWKSSGSGQENRINDRVDPLRWPRDTLYPQKLALTSPTSGGRSRSVGIVRLRTKGHGVSFSLVFRLKLLHLKNSTKFYSRLGQFDVSTAIKSESAKSMFNLLSHFCEKNLLSSSI